MKFNFSILLILFCQIAFANSFSGKIRNFLTPYSEEDSLLIGGLLSVNSINGEGHPFENKYFLPTGKHGIFVSCNNQYLTNESGDSYIFNRNNEFNSLYCVVTLKPSKIYFLTSSIHFQFIEGDGEINVYDVKPWEIHLIDNDGNLIMFEKIERNKTFYEVKKNILNDVPETSYKTNNRPIDEKNLIINAKVDIKKILSLNIEEDEKKNIIKILFQNYCNNLLSAEFVLTDYVLNCFISSLNQYNFKDQTKNQFIEKITDILNNSRCNDYLFYSFYAKGIFCQLRNEYEAAIQYFDKAIETRTKYDVRQLIDCYQRNIFLLKKLGNNEKALDQEIKYKFLKKNGFIYDGELLNRKPNGKGTSYYYDGAKYIGNWVNGDRQGNGTLFYARDYGKYEGEFYKNLLHGKGTLNFGPKDFVKCHYQINSAIGVWNKGIINSGIIQANDWRYEGGINNYLPYSNGKKIWNDGKIEEGNWKYGKLSK